MEDNDFDVARLLWVVGRGPAVRRAVFGVAMRVYASSRLSGAWSAHNLEVGIVSCPEPVPDPWDMADDFGVAMKELLATTR